LPIGFQGFAHRSEGFKSKYFVSVLRVPHDKAMGINFTTNFLNRVPRENAWRQPMARADDNGVHQLKEDRPLFALAESEVGSFDGLAQHLTEVLVTNLIHFVNVTVRAGPVFSKTI